MARDSQRSRVYAWERACVARLAHAGFYDPDYKTLDECNAFALPIWRKERARYGHAGKAAPAIERPNRGQRSALAHWDHRITLPRWARSRWVILHEMAHQLAYKDGHGARFVAVLIGLAARWLDYDAGQLMALADEMGVKYNVQSIGSVPVHGPVWHVERAVRLHGPMTCMDLACHLSLHDGVDVTPPVVRGAALYLIKHGRARWLRKKLVLQGDALPPPPEPPKQPRKASKPGPESVKGKAARYGIAIDRTDTLWWVYPPAALQELYAAADDDADPYVDEHHCDTWAEVRERVNAYAKDMDALLPTQVAA